MNREDVSIMAVVVVCLSQASSTAVMPSERASSVQMVLTERGETDGQIQEEAQKNLFLTWQLSIITCI